MKPWPIYVPTKGRAQSSKLLAMVAERLDLDVTVVVEPQEAAAYQAAFPFLSFAVLGANDRGITYSRSTILELARARGQSWLWMIDDDVGRFYRVVERKCVPADIAEVLLAAQEHVSPNVGQLALEYQQFAWSASKPAKLNSYCDVCVAVRTEGAPAYRDNTKEDRDFTMQVIASGRDVVRVCNLAFGAPANGSNKGGLHADYAAGKEPKWAANLAAQWPWCCEVQTKPSGRVDAKIHWKRVRAT